MTTFWYNPFPKKPSFLRVCSTRSTSLLKTLWEKEKLLVTSNFSFSHRVFYSFREFSTIFIKFEIVFCKLFKFGRLKFVVWERVIGSTFPFARACPVVYTDSINKDYRLTSNSQVGLGNFSVCLWFLLGGDVRFAYLTFHELKEIVKLEDCPGTAHRARVTLTFDVPE